MIERRYNMSRTFHNQRGKIRVKKAKKKSPAELRRLARALIALAIAEAESEVDSPANGTHKAGRQQDPPREVGAA
jgi:hypothetical protein